jgi:hypothetical protein
VLAVNNSCDESLAACRRLAHAHPEAVSVVHSRRGWGQAVRAGLAVARGPLIGFANSARTHSADLARAVACATNNPDALVKGRRCERSYSLVRRLGSRLYNAECRALFGIACDDVNGNPKLWRRELLAPELLRETGGFLDAEVIIRAHERGMRLVELPITRMDRHGGSSMTTARLAASLYGRPIAVRLRGVPPTAPDMECGRS